MEFKKYRRKQIAELREVSPEEIDEYQATGGIKLSNGAYLSISSEDLRAGSPKPGDMIARNPKNHNDKWLVAKEYFEENFEEI